MWKFVTRGIRESLERRACRTNIYSQNNDESITAEQQKQQLQEKQTKKCCFIKDLHRELKSPCLVTFARQHRKHFGTGSKDEQRNYDAKYHWSEAVGWSGVLAFGYVICQSIFIRRNLFEVDSSNLQKWKQKLISYPREQATQTLNNFLLPAPQYILPLSKGLTFNKQSTKPTEDLSQYVEDIFEDISEDLVDGAVNIQQFDAAVNIEQSYGPITAEEALKQAIDGFYYANELVLAELEFNSGVLAVEQKRFKDAVHHFTSGAEMSSIRSMFNLGLCYELGLGTEKDFRKAIKYYTEAAQGGHIDAMYNLGVYHAQGKGVNLNLNAAKHWFKKAAERGQLKAIKALQMEESFNKEISSKKNAENNLKVKTMKNIKTRIATSLVNYKNVFKNSIDTQTESDEFSNSSDNELSSPSPTDIFLGIIGMHEPSAIPLLSVRENNF